MEVILIKDIPRVGEKNDLIKVKRGYFLNYLLPNNLAKKATALAIKKAEELRAKRIMKKKELQEKALEVLKHLETITLNFREKVTSKKKLFGSITQKDIAQSLEKEGKIEIKKEDILLENPIKELGEHEIRIRLNENVIGKVKIKVEEENES